MCHGVKCMKHKYFVLPAFLDKFAPKKQKNSTERGKSLSLYCEV